jgi:L-ascorbate metabolism protein UlaG (beta-lactamase superfamily)
MAELPTSMVPGFFFKNAFIFKVIHIYFAIGLDILRCYSEPRESSIFDMDNPCKLLLLINTSEGENIMNQVPTLPVRITHIGGPTALIEIGSLRLLTDPTFDPAGSHYTRGSVEIIKKTGPALDASTIGAVDAVLLSHDHHGDNLDPAGRAYLPQARRVLTTPAGAQRLGGNALGVSTWQTVNLEGADGLRVRVTATPARHGPEQIEEVIGDVAGWIVEWDGQRHGALYISGDTVLFEGLEELAHRYHIGTALLHFGAAHVEVYGPFHLTMTGEEGAQFTRLLGKDATIIPIHYEGWAHFTQGRTEIEQAFASAGLEHRLRFLPFGQPTLIDA